MPMIGVLREIWETMCINKEIRRAHLEYEELCKEQEAQRHVIDIHNKYYKREPPMLTELKNLFIKEISLFQTCKVTAMVSNLVAEFSADKLKDGNSRDAAIDCIINLLEQEKTT